MSDAHAGDISIKDGCVVVNVRLPFPERASPLFGTMLMINVATAISAAYEKTQKRAKELRTGKRA